MDKYLTVRPGTLRSIYPPRVALATADTAAWSQFADLQTAGMLFSFHVYFIFGAKSAGGKCSMAPSPAATSSATGELGKWGRYSPISRSYYPFLILSLLRSFLRAYFGQLSAQQLPSYLSCNLTTHFHAGIYI